MVSIINDTDSSHDPYLVVAKDKVSGELNLHIESEKSAYRIAGPEHNENTVIEIAAKLTERDAETIRVYLDLAFHPDKKPNKESRSNLLDGWISPKGLEVAAKQFPKGTPREVLYIAAVLWQLSMSTVIDSMGLLGKGHAGRSAIADSEAERYSDLFTAVKKAFAKRG